MAQDEDGYCTVEDVRRALKEYELPGALSQDNNIVIDAITGQTEWFEKAYDRHYYVPGGIDEDAADLVPTGPRTRDDEHDLPTHGGMVHGASERERYRHRANSDALLESGPRYERTRHHREVLKRQIRIASGRANALERPVDESVPAYTRIQLNRRYATTLNELSVVNADGGYDDWVADAAYEGGSGNAHRGEDYWLRINNSGVSQLYLDVHAMDDDLVSLSNAVYVDFDYGHDGLPNTIRRAISLYAASDLVLDDDAQIGIPDQGNLVQLESKSDAMKKRAADLLEEYT